MFKNKNEERKMKVLKALAVMAVVVILAGCASVKTAGKADFNGRKLTMGKGVKDIAHINGDNWGLYFLWFPLITGSTEPVGEIVFLKDTVKLDKVVDIVTAKSKELGAKEIVDLQSNLSSFGFLFKIKDVQVSGNAVK
jgi:hypothetical protein